MAKTWIIISIILPLCLFSVSVNAEGNRIKIGDITNSQVVIFQGNQFDLGNEQHFKKMISILSKYPFLTQKLQTSLNLHFDELEAKMDRHFKADTQKQDAKLQTIIRMLQKNQTASDLGKQLDQYEAENKKLHQKIFELEQHKQLGREFKVVLKRANALLLKKDFDQYHKLFKEFSANKKEAGNQYQNEIAETASVRAEEYAARLDYKNAVIQMKEAVKYEPKNGAYWFRYGEYLGEIARYDDAIIAYSKALKIDLKASGESHPDVAASYNQLGIMWGFKGDYGKAIGFYSKALEATNFYKMASEIRDIILKSPTMRNTILKNSAQEDEYQDPSGGIYNNLGEAWRLKGDYDKAIEFYTKALKVNLNVFGEQHSNVAGIYNNIGAALYSKGDYDKAMEFYTKALKINLNVFGEHHPRVATIYNNLGEAWRLKNSDDKAIEFYTKALKINLNVFGEHHPRTAINYTNLGLAWGRKGADDKAIRLHTKALKINLNVFGEQHSNVARSYNHLGLVWSIKGADDKAIRLHTKALKIYQHIFSERHPEVGMSYFFLGMVWNFKGENDRAKGLYSKALNILEKSLGKNHPRTNIIRKSITGLQVR